MKKKIKQTRITINGPCSLKGTVTISGAKNAALPELAASILSAQPFQFENVPNVEDLRVMFHALENLGAQGRFNGNTVNISIPRITSPLVPKDIVETSRASVLILGPLVARNGYAKVSTPGGCPIGDRKINYHLDGLSKMGAWVHEGDGHIIAETKGRLKGVDYHFQNKTVTGTENLLMAATLAEGTTILRNCALEPEIGDLIDMLIKMGAKIEGKNTETITIQGRETLNGCNHTVIPDRIEMGTYVIAGCLNHNQITVANAIPEYIQCLLDMLETIGVKFTIEADKITVHPNGHYHPVEVETKPYPHYPTDLQAQLTTFLTQVNGISHVKENIFNNRFQHAYELDKMGAQIEVNGDVATITGPTPLTGQRLTATDLRASAALVLGGLIAQGTTVVDNAYQLLRGYEDMPGKLKKLGADIELTIGGQ